MDPTINQKFNEEMMQLLNKDETEDEVCLIDGMPLTEQFVELKCAHKFNYLSIFNEIFAQKKYNNLETQKLHQYQIKCPYCRNIHNGVLSYQPTLSAEKIRGVNWPPSRVLKSNKCEGVFKSGKRKGEKCSKSCINKYCTMHSKISSISYCISLLKSGKRKGEKCGCKCKKNSEKCGRHIPKNSIK